ncbi:MAG: azurin, partial [Rhodothermales bacterium]
QYLLLTGDSGKQGAIVPLEGEFRSGVVRGRMRSQDENIYIVGCEGWGNYALDDGCLHRLRYTGQPMRRPIGFGVTAKGIRIDFEEKLLAPETQSVFVQSWNVEYASRYGSPEFSVQHPESLGHDVLNVRSSQLLNDGKSLFLEIPDLRPACQVHIRMHLQTADGIAFKTDIFPTIRRFGDANLKPMIRVAAAPSKRKKKGPKPDRSITLKAIPGLQYNRTELTAAPGERLEIRLQNIDPAMPHNWVLIKPGATKAVGEASFKMLSDPAAAEKSYVPDLRDVLAFVPIVPPNGKGSVVFRVPKTPGEYPFICTFPGHWQAMKGVLVVAEP